MQDKLENKLLNLSSYLAATILVLAPVWPFISVWLSRATGHYTLIRLILALTLALLILAVASLLALDRILAARLIKQKWFWLLAAFVALEVIWGAVAYFTNAVSLKALGYAWIVDLRYLLFFVAVYLLRSSRLAHFEFFPSDARRRITHTAHSASREENPNCAQERSPISAAETSDFLGRHWPKLIFIPALVVAVFAVLQFLVLPLNFLGHFGYNSHTIFPYETINHNKNYIRATGFTRGANPLGAYMLLAASLAASLLAGLASLAHLGPKSVLRGTRTAKVRSASVLDFEPNCTQARKSLVGGFVILILALAALAFSFSRSAWVGAVVSFILLIWLALANARARKLALAFGVALVIVFAILFASFHNDSSVSNVFLHTQKNSASKVSSNQGHVSALENGFKDFASDPLGNGPGTAGPASVYNQQAPARISENYYLMIGEEDGWLGLALLLAIFVLVARALASRKSILALGLLASFVGLAVTNFLLPAWTDITLAYIFWGLAAVAIAPPQTNSDKAKNS